jgi:uncharacterized membrane protein
MTVPFRSRAASWLKTLTRIVLVALFTLAAIDKLAHFSGFITAIWSYHILPERTVRFAAIFIIMAELAIALGLLTKRWRQSACLAAVLLLATFTIVYLVAPPEGICGCWFTLTLNTGGPVHILQNLIFIGLSVLTWLDSQSSSTVSGVSSVSYPESHSTAAQESDDGRLRHVR